MKSIYAPRKDPAKVAGFMSGTGSNITKLLEWEARLRERPGGTPFTVCVVVSDSADPKRCNARQIAKRFGELPVVELDVRAFYRERGLKSTSLMTDRGFQVREEWTQALLERLKPFSVDLGAFGGFEPLSNVMRAFPCINVHPGDLSVLRDGKPYLVGLHTIPIKRAILGGVGELRSSTLLLTPYTRQLEMDEGPVLMISEPLKIEIPAPLTLEWLGGPEGAETLETLASEHQSRLKEVGDWHIFPLTVELVARGRFGLDAKAGVWFDGVRLERGLKLPSDRV